MRGVSKLKEEATQITYDRILELLLPPPPSYDARDAAFQSTRQKLRNLLAVGTLDNRLVEIEVLEDESDTDSISESFDFETAIKKLLQVFPSEELRLQLTQLLKGEIIEQIARRKVKRQRMTVREVIEVWSNEEYEKLKAATAEIEGESALAVPPEDIIVVQESLLKLITKSPDLLYKITHWQFEELVGELFDKLGYTVELTSRTRDGGCDLIAFTEDKIGVKTKYVIEAKHYRPENRVGVTVVRQLSAVRQKFGAHHGILVTSSYFTKDAIAENNSYYGLHLSDYNKLLEWMRKL